MKHLTIRAKITILFIVILTFMLGLTYGVFYFSSESILRDMIQNELCETVEYDIEEIDAYKSKKAAKKNKDSKCIKYGDVYLCVDDEFLELMGGIGVGLYDSDGEKLYGEDLISDVSKDLPFRDGETHTVKSGPDTFYVYDRKVGLKKADGLWLRGAVDRGQKQEEVDEVFHFALLLLPLLILLAAIFAYVITKRSLRPINRMIEAAETVSGGSDLKRRIDMGEGNNEVQHLAESFNAMMERLDESFEAEKQFTSDVSHELRTPMATILGQCELALDEEELTPEEARDALTMIRRNADRMNDMISDMLTYTRIGRHHEKYPLSPVDLTYATMDVCDEFMQAHPGEIRLETDIADGINIQGNELLLRRMLLNLMENGLRYGGSLLKVVLERSQGVTALSVEDDGIGIEQEYLDKIFDRFYQIDPSRSNQGTGLGLAIVKQVAEVHGAEIAVTSEVGKGSKFTLTFS